MTTDRRKVEWALARTYRLMHDLHVEIMYAELKGRSTTNLLDEFVNIWNLHEERITLMEIVTLMETD